MLGHLNTSSVKNHWYVNHGNLFSSWLDTTNFLLLPFIKVAKGLDDFLFKLVILRAVKDHSGNVWRRKSTDMYVVEITTDKLFETLTTEDVSSDQNNTQVGFHCFTCIPPP